MLSKPYIIAIGGGTGSGKSTLVQLIEERLGAHQVAILHTDAFFKPGTPTHNQPVAIDAHHLREAVEHLHQGEAAQLPSRGAEPATRLEPKALILVEGHLCLCFPWIYELADLTIFVDMDAEERVMRRIERNIQRQQDLQFITDWYRKDVLDNHRIYVEPTRKLADIILWGEWNERRLSRVVEMIKRLSGV